MEQKDQKGQEKNLSELMEFDFDDILMDDFPGDKRDPAGYERTHKEETQKASDSSQNKRQEPAQKKAQSKKEKRKRGLKITFDIATWIKDLLLAVLVIWILTTFVAESVKVPDGSMNPTLQQNEHVLISKLVYRFKEPDRGDILLFEYEAAGGEKQEAISRVIGVPGDKIVIDETGTITVNGKEFITSYCNGKTAYMPNQMIYPYTVPSDFYFVLSDNPSGKTDSRYQTIGAVSKSDIIGRVFVCWWPKEAWRPIG
ncbi:MAG: signal peptidase I [Lachnospiraceae bacterium]|jgi:signal peptidase I|nr:signal peptidase I [Lachnospiraceae bacterium]